MIAPSYRLSDGEAPAFVVELSHFTGPLDLLLSLIRDEQLDIYDIPIARIAEQFLARIGSLGLDEAADYLFATGRHTGRDSSRRPDLVVSDLKLPKVDGLELVTRIREAEQTQAVPVVMLSTSAQADDLLRAYRDGVNSYVRKPIEAVRFSAVIQELSSYWLLLNELPPAELTTLTSEEN